MTKHEKVSRAIQAHTAALEKSFLEPAGQLAGYAEKLVGAFHQGGRLLVFGNGPLGAVAELTANLFVHRLWLDRPLLPALALCSNLTLASALARDGQQSEVFARMLKAVAAPGDLVLAMCDARRDEAIEEGLSAARQIGCSTAALVPGPGELTGDPPDFLFSLHTDSPARATEAALFFGHLLCELVEGELFGI
ncbi:phosphoheptose isomerase [Desulfuromonas versatilis]|uniref:Phosphoheptose isomerase n=1 Tax=Desulfuromonas versatilis TaxID=2802975 RepID=A0ABN6DU35_9BACT|nr:SIS domain-containing protein [Desulfuromonas versatilis]BCR03501.1 phosphoheptose isomerase [Desulfuromonas versatilis]